MNIPSAAWPYLILQQGRLDDLKADPKAWQAAYEAELQLLLDAITPHLPVRCLSLLDVGGGMGGIDVLLARRYPDARVAILDGRADPPALERHGATFNDLSATAAFQLANGVRRPRLRLLDAADPGTPQPVDLVVSFASWCFHYPPAAYLRYVTACSRPGTRLILDVRKRIDWQAELAAAFDPIAVCGETAKFTRVVYVAR